MAAERELGVDPLLDRRQAELLEPLDLDAHERLELEIRERPPCHSASAARNDAAAAAASPRRKRLAAVAGEPLEVLQVELARLDAQQVAGCARDEPRLARRAPGSRTLRSRETWLRSAWSAEFTLWSAKSSPISRSRDTTRFALSSSSASSARCFGPPAGTTAPSTRTVSGPRMRNSRRGDAMSTASSLAPPGRADKRPRAA